MTRRAVRNSSLHYMSNCDAALIAAPTFIKIHLSISIAISIVHCFTHTGTRISTFAMPFFMIFASLAGRVRALFLSYVPSETLYDSLSGQNPAATDKLFFADIGGDVWCYVFQYILVGGHSCTQRGLNSGRGFRIADLNYA